MLCNIMLCFVLCHAVQVAVGEKHTLLVQSWVAPALPDSSDDYTSLVTLSSSNSGSNARSHNRSHQQQQHVESDTEEDLLLYGEAVDSLSPGGSSSLAAAAAARGSSGDRSQPPIFNSTSDHSGLAGTDDAGHDSSSRRSGGQDLGPESLHSICQRVVALQLVEPRTAPTLLEYADVASAHLLKAYCLAVAVRNMDSCIAEARPAFEALPQHLLQQVRGERQIGRVTVTWTRVASGFMGVVAMTAPIHCWASLLTGHVQVVARDMTGPDNGCVSV
jgi:hypothetical protein